MVARFLLAVCMAGSLIAAMACTPPGQGATHPSPTPSFVVTSPAPLSTWAKFDLGADRPHKTLADGLQITDIGSGSPSIAGTKDEVTVRYAIWLSDGTLIDSRDAHSQPFQFTLGIGFVIKGWDEGIQGMGVGGIRRLVVPPGLGYGEEGVANSSGGYQIPPNATLVSVIWLVALSHRTG